MSEIIKTLSSLAAKRKLVPFLGAGCSASMLPSGDRLKSMMRQALGDVVYTNHAEIAQLYVDMFGRDAFYRFLKENLSIDTFDDEKGFIHLTMMRLGVPVIYTTNQDNVMEKGFEKHGIPYKKIIDLRDFEDTTEDEQLYIKFHGDLDVPDSIVFTTEDYVARIKERDHAMNARLRGDLLAKNLLFVGYSFQDTNIQQLFTEVREVFYGELPTSYMIAYEYTEALQSLCDDFGILLIDPMVEVPQSESHHIAFAELLNCMLEMSTKK